MTLPVKLMKTVSALGMAATPHPEISSQSIPDFPRLLPASTHESTDDLAKWFATQVCSRQQLGRNSSTWRIPPVFRPEYLVSH